MSRWSIALAGVWALGIPLSALAKPIAFAQGTTVMAEYGAGTMRELQVFYAPRYFLSGGAGHLELDSDIDHRSRDITYARLNYLAKRWNLEDAQANVFTWGSLGRATTSESNEASFVWNAGGQLDFETRRLYACPGDKHHADCGRKQFCGSCWTRDRRLAREHAHGYEREYAAADRDR